MSIRLILLIFYNELRKKQTVKELIFMVAWMGVVPISDILIGMAAMHQGDSAGAISTRVFKAAIMLSLNPSSPCMIRSMTPFNKSP
jgi:hypothetical protein